MRALKALVLAGLLAPAFLSAQEHAHTPQMVPPPSASPLSPGQDAFGAIAEVVRALEADSSTDWSKVDLEALRQHLIDMHEVTLRSAVSQEAVSGGARFTVVGQGRTLDAIRRMARAHASMVGVSGIARVTVEDVASGVRLTVLAADPSDPASVAKIRGLGFIGFLTTGDHHGPHHLALARGTPPASHAHE
jgi:hypothetical protein